MNWLILILIIFFGIWFFVLIIWSLIKWFGNHSKNQNDYQQRYKEFYDNLNEINNRNKHDIIRNQGKFREEIAKIQLKKKNIGGIKRKDLINKVNCLVCNFPFFLIGSHIYRFADIKSDYQKGIINKEEAEEFKAAGYNGFLLCPNHDKMFENGYIYFSLLTNNFKVNSSLSEDKRLYIEKTLKGQKPYNVDPNDYEKFKFCVLKHQERINVVDTIETIQSIEPQQIIDVKVI